jgi:hypothetical protein
MPPCKVADVFKNRICAHLCAGFQMIRHIGQSLQDLTLRIRQTTAMFRIFNTEQPFAWGIAATR